MVRKLAVPLTGIACVILTGCGSTSPLPPYEPPLAKTRVQNVRTTAYTHTESDHLEYSNHNALGGILHVAAMPDPRMSNLPTMAEIEPRPGSTIPLPRSDDPAEGGFHPAGELRPVANTNLGYSNNPLPPRVDSPPAGSTIPTSGVGSAAADWSRWPAGTVFRIPATGQVYEVDDYGWALAGRNTIDLYQPTRAAMNAWGARKLEIEILRWGDPAESLRKLRHHQEYRHIRRMVFELEGRNREAAALE